jgi:hypothetical protein
LPKKRNYQLVVALFALTIAIISIFLYYNQYELNVNTNEASISYSFSNAKNNVFLNFTGGYNYTGAINSIPINGYNSGKKDGDFNIVINFVNATISTTPNQPYIINNSTSAEFRMVLHPGESGTNQAYYNIDSNVTSYSIKLSVHSNQGYLKTNPVYPTYVVFSYSRLFPNFFALQSADGLLFDVNS